MRRECRVWWLAFCSLTVAACGSAVRPDGGDGTPGDQVIVGDGIAGDNGGNDIVNPPTDGDMTDNGMPADDVVGLDGDPTDVFDPDATPTDALVEDIPLVDGPVADVPSPDAGPLCANGITNVCPATAPGPCPNLGDGMPHTVTFTGLTTGIPASCEGMTSGAGPDGIMPLVITTTQDVVITAMPTGGDVVVIALYPAAGCGTLAGETRCSNSSAAMGGVARIQVSSLMPGTYYVQVAAGRGSPAIVQAMLTMPRPRMMADVCPAATVVPDGAPTTLSTTGFATDADYGTTCGGGTVGHVDAVFSYTLAAARDVTVTVTATGGGGNITADVTTACGDRSTALPGCVAAATVMRRFRNQAAGTYYITADYMGGPGRSFVVTVTTAAPTMPPAADRCPGVALTAGAAATVIDTATIAADYALACAAGNRADAVFNFMGPAAGNDVVLFGTSTTGGTSMQLQSMCGMAASNIPACLSTGAGSAWQRYRGLTAGTTYSGIIGTGGITGMLSGRYVTIPTAAPMATMGNDLCTAATMITEAGGIFTGNTMAFADNTNLPAACGGGCGGGVDAMYRLTITSAGGRRVLISTVGSAFDTLVFIRTLTPAAMPATDCSNQRAGDICNDNYYGNAAAIDVRLPVGQYWIAMSGCGGAARGAYTLDVITLP